MSELLVCMDPGAAVMAAAQLGCAQWFWWAREPLPCFCRTPGTSGSPLPWHPPPSPQVPVVVAGRWRVPHQGGEAAVAEGH